jgi:hypothetical protein
MVAKRECVVVGCAALLSLGVGCSSGDKPSENDYDSVAQALGGVTATDDGGGEVGTMIDVSVIAAGSPSLGIELDASGSFTGTRLGVTYDYDVACADSAGQPLDPCSNASDSADVDVKWSGELTTPVLSGSVSRTGMIKVSNIQSGIVTIAGQGSLSVEAHFQALLRDASRDYHLSYAADYRDLRVQRAPAKMVGGTIHYALDVERMATNGTRESSANFEIDAELVFNADGGATLTLDGDHHFTIDTHTGAVASVNAATKT